MGGWHAGVDRFCQADHAYHFGKTGETYHNVCSDERNGVFVENYKKGLETFRFEASIDRIKKKVKKLEREAQAAVGGRANGWGPLGGLML